jgi:hypothetical protein
LEWCLLLFDAEAVLGATGFLNFLFLQGMFAYGQDHSFAETTHYDGVLEQDRVWVFLDVSGRFVVRALLNSFFGICYVRIVILLINLHVHLFDKYAISGDAVSLVKQNDITNDKLINVDGLRGSILTSENSDFLIHDFSA